MKKISKIILTSFATCSLPLSLIATSCNARANIEYIEVSGENTIETESTVTYTVLVSPINASKNVVWSVDDETYATIDSKSGVLTTKEKAGQITITATSTSNPKIKGELMVNIVAAAPKEMTINGDDTIHVFSEPTLYTISPTPASADTSVTWSIVNGSNIAQIDDGGNLYATDSGEITIRARSKVDEMIYCDKKINILEPETTASWDDVDWFVIGYYAKHGIDALKERFRDEYEREDATTGKIANSFIGSIKQLTINLEYFGYKTFEFKVVGQEHDDLADGSGKAALSFVGDLVGPECVNWNTETWWDDAQNTWYDKENDDPCVLNNYLNTVMYKSINRSLVGDSGLKNLIRPVVKETLKGSGSTDTLISTQYIFIPSIAEMYNSNAIKADPKLSSYSSAYLKEGFQYEYYSNLVDETVVPTSTVCPALEQYSWHFAKDYIRSCSYWLRSPCVNDEGDVKTHVWYFWGIDSQHPYSRDYARYLRTSMVEWNGYSLIYPIMMFCL